MSNRLSEDSVIASWDAGQGLSVVSTPAARLSQPVDLAQLLALEDPKPAVEAIDRRDMYLAIVQAQGDEALEILPHLSKEQFTAIIDYEGWDEDRISIHKVARWLELYKHFGVDQMFNRFKELDEEYQTALLASYVEVVDEETYEVMSHDRQDEYQPLPGNTMWYRFMNADAKTEDFLTSLIQGGLGEDLNYTYSLLSHATYLPPNEQEELMRQFRSARLEEDGFALPEDSRKLFAPFDGKELFNRWRKTDHFPKESQSLTSAWSGDASFLDAVFAQIQNSGQYDFEAKEQLERSFAVLANMLAASFKLGADDVTQLAKLLEQSKGIVSIGLEVLADAQVSKGAEVLMHERPKTVFQFALSMVDTIREDALEVIRENDWPGYQQILSSFQNRHYGRVMWHIDRELLDNAGFENVERLKGLFSRIPLVAKEFMSEGDVKRCSFRAISTVSDLTELKSQIETMRPIGRSILEPVTVSAKPIHS